MCFFLVLKSPSLEIGWSENHHHQPTLSIRRGWSDIVQDDNVHCVAIKGTFDDCQDIVKESGVVREDVSFQAPAG